MIRATIALTLFASAASAGTLYDNQYNPDWFDPSAGLQGFFNEEPSNPSPFLGRNQAYVVSDITVGAGGWNIDSITTYYGGSFPYMNGYSEAVINIYSKTGPLPIDGVDAPFSNAPGAITASVTVTTEILAGNNVFNTVTASGLNIDLAEGEYWIGMTPFGAPTSNIQSVQLPGLDDNGDADAIYFVDPLFGSMWSDGVFGSPGAYDAAMTITGVPAPAGAMAFGVLGAFAARRRRA